MLICIKVRIETGVARELTEPGATDTASSCSGVTRQAARRPRRAPDSHG
jgi:hypothetical protein